MSSKSKNKRNKKKEKDNISTGASPLPPEKKKEILPYLVVKLLTGAQIHNGYHVKNGSVCIHWNNEREIINEYDFDIIRNVANSVYNEIVKEKNLSPSLMTIPVGLKLHFEAYKRICKIVDNNFSGKKKILFIKDLYGCGYWRMVVPSRYMDYDKYCIDLTENEVNYENLLDYDVIVVQRLHNWREYYVIDSLKRNGKRIVYDIDDNIFNIDATNPVAHYIKLDELEAARSIMKISDTIITTTDILKEQLGFQEKTIVVPNSIDFNDGYQTIYSAPEDERRILWMGSATHGVDWLECIEAIDRILKENDDVRLIIVGYIPDCVRDKISNENNIWWDGRVMYETFKDVESYVSLSKTLKANCAIAPLQNTKFNICKSNLKWLEYTASCIPTIASNVSPYKEDIINGKNGFLASNVNEWYENINKLLNDNQLCADIVNTARITIEDKYDIKSVVYDWEKAIIGE